MLGGIVEIISSKPQETPCPPQWGGWSIIFQREELGLPAFPFLGIARGQMPKQPSVCEGQLPYLWLSLTSIHHTHYLKPYSKPGCPSGPFTAGEQVLAELLIGGSESEVVQSCLTLWDPMDCSPPGSSIHGIFQARVLEWVVISLSRGSSLPRDRTRVSRIVSRHFYHLSHQGSKFHFCHLLTCCVTLGGSFSLSEVRSQCSKSHGWAGHSFSLTTSAKRTMGGKKGSVWLRSFEPVMWGTPQRSHWGSPPFDSDFAVKL